MCSKLTGWYKYKREYGRIWNLILSASKQIEVFDCKFGYSCISFYNPSIIFVCG